MTWIVGLDVWRWQWNWTLNKHSVSVGVCVFGGGHWGLIYSFHTMAFTSLPLAGVNLVGWSALFALAYVPENTMSLHRSLSQLSDKRLGRAATCATLFRQTIRGLIKV